MKNLAEIFKSISQETRLRIYNLLIISEREMNGITLGKALGKPPYAISRHINILVKSGLINARREGQNMIYSLSPATRKIRIEMLGIFDSLCADPSIFENDVARLREIENKQG